MTGTLGHPGRMAPWQRRIASTIRGLDIAPVATGAALRVRDGDPLLASRLAGTSVKYVSIRDETLCSGKEQGGDGIHMTFKGYQYIWNKARLAAGIPDSGPAIATYTGKASTVLKRKLSASGIQTTNKTKSAQDEEVDNTPYCGTIHSLIYTAIEE